MGLEYLEFPNKSVFLALESDTPSLFILIWEITISHFSADCLEFCLPGIKYQC